MISLQRLTMYTFEFESISDIFISHYTVSLIISFVFILITFIISRTYVIQIKSGVLAETESSICVKKSKLIQEEDSMNATSGVKKSPAIVAEKVIKANMTEEQKLREQEVRKKQLAQIYELMQKQSDKFGNISLSEVEEQFKLYQ